VTKITGTKIIAAGAPDSTAESGMRREIATIAIIPLSSLLVIPAKAGISPVRQAEVMRSRPSPG
jgi:hypothetical protein